MKINNICYTLLIISIYLIINRYIIEKKEIIIETKKIKNTIENITSYPKKNIDDIYDAILSIPQINMK